MAYRIVTVDLSTLSDRRQIVGRDLTIYNISVLSLTPGAAFDIHPGQREGIPIDSRGTEIHGFCPPEVDGLFVSHAAQPGAEAVLYVDFSGVQVTSEP